MGKIIIMTDSASDISEKEEKELGIKILPFPVVIGGKSYLSRVDFGNEGFYKLMAENDDLPKTSQITAYQFGEVYKELVEQGYTDIIYVSINKDGSASYANAKQAADQFEEEYPECAGKSSIYVFDGIGYSGQYGYPVIVAATKGDPDAMKMVLQHFSGYIARLSMRKLYDERGNVYFGIDNDIRERLQAKLMMAVLNFRTEK